MKKENPEPTNTQQGRTQIHNVRFYNLTPRSILCMAYNKVRNKLALSRNDGSLEVWDMQFAPLLEITIPETPGNSVEGIAWSDKRLFSAGISGEVAEWNLKTLRPLRVQHVTGNSIWCMNVNGTGSELAVATEEGYINILDITEDQLMHKLLLDKQEGRILCCKYDATGDFLVTGSMDAIRIWNVKTGHAIHKMSVARSEKKKEVIVWSLEVLIDFTIISGDSRGVITVWDGKTATYIESHQVLDADVLAVAVNESQNLVICSGIEPIIRIYAKTQIKGENIRFNRWVKFLQRSVHDHDVKALVCVDDRILSGGMDGYLGISSSSNMRSAIAKYGPFLQNPCVTLATDCRLLLLRYSNYLEVWRLGTSNGKPAFQTNDEEPSQMEHTIKCATFELDTGPEKLLEFKSKHEQAIVCATISPDGNWICYSTLDEVRLFRFCAGEREKSAAQLTRVKVLPEQFEAAAASAMHAYFGRDSKRLFLVNGVTKEILIFKMLPPNESTDIDFIESIRFEKYIRGVIKRLIVSECGQYIVAAGSCRSIAVWHVSDGKYFKHYLNLPRYTAPISDIALRPTLPNLVAAFSDGKIFEYDLEEMCFSCSEKIDDVSSIKTHCVQNIVLDARNPDVIILQNDANLFVLQKCTAKSNADDEAIMMDELPLEGSRTKKRQSAKKAKSSERSNSNDKVARLQLRFQKQYEHLIYLCCLSSNELVAVGVNPVSLIEQLPAVFKQKKFGVA